LEVRKSPLWIVTHIQLCAHFFNIVGIMQKLHTAEKSVPVNIDQKTVSPRLYTHTLD